LRDEKKDRAENGTAHEQKQNLLLLKNLIEFYDYFVFVLPMFVFQNAEEIWRWIEKEISKVGINY